MDGDFGMTFNLADEMGGEEALRGMMRDFYDRVFDDAIIGFLFAKSDKEALVESQIDFVTAHLGDRSGAYEGPNIREAHRNLPILTGQFDRRHQILKETLIAHEAPEHVVEAWLALDQSLRNFVVNLGAQKRDEILHDDS